MSFKSADRRLQHHLALFHGFDEVPGLASVFTFEGNTEFHKAYHSGARALPSTHETLIPFTGSAGRQPRPFPWKHKEVDLAAMRRERNAKQRTERASDYRPPRR